MFEDQFAGKTVGPSELIIAVHMYFHASFCRTELVFLPKSLYALQ